MKVSILDVLIFTFVACQIAQAVCNVLQVRVSRNIYKLHTVIKDSCKESAR